MNRGSNWWLKILSAIVVLVLCILLLSHSRRDSGDRSFLVQFIGRVNERLALARSRCC